jgi:hypothetical protein
VVIVNRRVHEKRSGPGLARGQVWKLRHVYIQVVELGKRLLEYRMMDSLDEQGVRTQVSGIDVMWGYLTTRHARLIKG